MQPLCVQIADNIVQVLHAGEIHVRLGGADNTGGVDNADVSRTWVSLPGHSSREEGGGAKAKMMLVTEDREQILRNVFS